MSRYSKELEVAVGAAREAGEILREEFLRPGGPRGSGGHCEADGTAEALLRRRLAEAFPEDGIRGEELGDQDRRCRGSSRRVWLLDPNDGTAAFLQGWRGAAVSVALVSGGLPVLGVVYAYAARSGCGDLFAWAEGHPLERNGRVVPAGIRPPTVLVSQRGDSNPRANARLCAPLRYRCEPSIAYRLALVAAGEGVAAVSLNGPADWDVAGGHALLRGAGGDLLRMGGAPVRYGPLSSPSVGDCVGGFAPHAERLSRLDWGEVFERSEIAADLVGPSAGGVAGDAGLLDRAAGCLAGQLAGDSLGSLCEFRPAAEVARRYPGGPRSLEDGGTWNTLAGQPTDDSELALSLARSIAKEGRYDREAVARGYAEWLASGPFDRGHTTGVALGAAMQAMEAGLGGIASAAERAALGCSDSQANGALMRISPLAIWGWGLEDGALADLARADAALTHASPVCRDANAVFAVALARAVRGGGPPEAICGRTLEWARRSGVEALALAALEGADEGPPEDVDGDSSGWVLIALQNAFHELLRAGSVEEGLARTVSRGGDTDTNAAVAGALLGAARGLDAFPRQWVDRLLTCRPLSGLPGCVRPRPARFWPVDFRTLAERLLRLGK